MVRKMRHKPSDNRLNAAELQASTSWRLWRHGAGQFRLHCRYMFVLRRLQRSSSTPPHCLSGAHQFDTLPSPMCCACRT